MGDSTPFPSSAAIARAEQLTRERFVFDGETREGRARPGLARRRALDAALAEVEAGLKVPSLEWRQEYSLLLGLERVLSEDEPKLVDGTVLSAHQVDALSGTLTALLAAAQTALPVTRRRPPLEVDAEIERRFRRRRRRRRSRPSPRPEDDDALEELEAADEPRTTSRRTGRTTRTSTRTSRPRALDDDPGADRRFWFEHATGAGKTVAAVGFVEASRTGGVLILTHRRNLVDQFIGELKTAATATASASRC